MSPVRTTRFVPIDCPFAEWQPVHACVFEINPRGGAVLTDLPDEDWHLMRFESPECLGLIRLTVRYQPLPGCVTDLYVNQWGGIDVCHLSLDGQVRSSGVSRAVSVRRQGDEFIAEIEWLNLHPSIAVGTSQGTRVDYKGRGQPQFVIHEISAARGEVCVPEDDVVVMVDVGAAGDIPIEWKAVRSQILPVLFEPDKAQADALAESHRVFDPPEVPPAQVLSYALYNRDTTLPVYVTRFLACSSLLRPDPARLAGFAVAPLFEVVRQAEVQCRRYDSLHTKEGAPVPDIIKIDVQGVEYEVLEGFGGLLDHCVGITLETHTIPIYEGQKTIGDILGLMDRWGFELRLLQPQDSFDGVAVEYNAYFTRRLHCLPEPVDLSLRKLRLAEEVWGLRRSGLGQQLLEGVLGSATPSVAVGAGLSITVSG
jgi:FkbM family methyltransferase